MRAEDIARQAQDAADIPGGSTVRIYTRMGNLVCEGQSGHATTAGLCVGDQFYAARLYRFVVEAHPQALDDEKTLTLPVDRRIADLEEGRIGNNEAAKKGQAHPDNLPDDIRTAVITTSELTEPQINRVLAAVGDAALHVLKDLGVSEGEVYGRVQVVQTAVREALKPTTKDKQRAKAKKKAEDEEDEA